MMLNRRFFLGGTASVAVMAALAACAKNSEGGSSGESDTASAMNPQERSALQEGGELKLGLTQSIANWNTSTVAGNTVDTQDLMRYVNPSFIDIADDNTITPNPNFLTTFEAEEVDGKTVVTVALNDKAVWGNGRSMSSEDIEASLAHGKDEAYLWASTDGLDRIESVEIIDDLTAKVTFESLYPEWQAPLSGFGPKELFVDAETFNTALEGNDVTSYNDYFAGPFKLDSYDQAAQRVTLVPNEKWWGDKPLLDKVICTVLDPAAEATAFANKSLDVIDNIISADVYNQCIGRDDAEVRQNFGLQWRHFTLNAASGPLADKAVRQALLRACDRKAIAESDLAGLPVEPDKLLLGNRFFMPSQDGYQDNSTDWSYDVEAAKKLLDDAGWVPGADGIREKDGQRLSFAFTLPAGTPTSENEGTLLQSQIKEVGMEMTLRTVDVDGYFTEYINPGNYEITAFTWQKSNFPMAYIKQTYGTGSNSNYSGQSIPEIDELITKIDTTADNDERIRMTNEVDKLVWENVMNFPMYQRAQLTAVPKNLANFGARGLASYRTENIGFVKE